jgi:membrane protein DedA with SNARE-associated domain/rhodanese-related sulfurtransferase
MAWLSGFGGEPGLSAVVLFAFAENIGLPIPAFPVLILAGALSRAGGVDIWWAICGATIGAVAADVAWYRIGQWRGRRVLSAICRLSLNPDSCLEASDSRFRRHRISTILIAKFVPGLNAVTPPLAAIVGMPLRHFVLADTAGAVGWAVAGIGGGWIMGAAVAPSLEAVRGVLGWAMFGGIVLFLLWNALSRYLLVRRYGVPRIPAGDLHGKIARGEDVLVIDLRSDDSFAASSAMIPSALRVRPAAFRQAAKTLPTDRELVFYCSCPHEAASASLARILIDAGHRRVAALRGGFEAWESEGLPTQPTDEKA